ncbi:MAG: Fic family protein [Nereida ignava]
MQLFDKLGFRWNRDAVPAGVFASVDRSVFRFKQMLAQFVFDASSLEGNPFTFPQVQTLMDGVTVGGHKISDEQQVLNLAAAGKELLSLVKGGNFELNKATFDRLHALVAKEEAWEWGHFRGEGKETEVTWPVQLGKDEYWPERTEAGAANLNRIFSEGVGALGADVPDPRERGLAFFLFGALQQFYFDGNKRTSRFMMNGVLMSHGFDAISVPAKRAQEFNENMVRFYLDKDATEMMGFLIDCQPMDAPKPRPTPNYGPSM